ncbi:tRNA (N6-threonylcarbamoyladenosine(37)-N6)-methyltransferase TrmO, partial [bacterium]|nr:tRNA (N6-threonylcarbamoyladenosine(37)-N6)-methyltransferase TrmO [bacterium]
MNRRKQRLRRLPEFVARAAFCVVIVAQAVSCCGDRQEVHTVRKERTEDSGMVFNKIGVIRSPYSAGKPAPRQGSLAPGVESMIVMEPEYETGLKDIETFSHIIVFYVFDRSSGWNPLVQTPWEQKRHGVFATRSPRRPNPIGMTVVKLVGRSGSTLHVQGLDAFDGSPVI